MARLLTIDFHSMDTTMAALPDLINQVRTKYKDLDISDEILETILGFAFKKGYHEGIVKFEEALNSEDIKIKIIDSE